MPVCPALADNDEIDRYEQSLQRFRQGELDEEYFTAVRLQHGIYGQRQNDVNMIRVKLPGGALNPPRLRILADIQAHYSNAPFASITTRQDIQMHFIKLDDTPAIMRTLATVGLTSREACGNTVRNVTACSLAGICPREHTDVRVVLNRMVQHFLRHPLTQHLPRKFKISFSGCEADCAQGMIHDLAVVAIKRDDRYGFKILAGGGLGHKPHEAVVVEEFVTEGELLSALEAIVTVHHRYSDRRMRARSRIKFLVDRFGKTDFVEKCREEFSRTYAAYSDMQLSKLAWREAVDAQPPGPGAPRLPLPQMQAGLLAVPVSIALGDITADQLRSIADVMDSEGLADARATQDQNLVLCDVPFDRVTEVYEKLQPLGLGEPQSGDNVVACPGTWTCRLGITNSRDAAKQLCGAAHDLRIRVSGCQNGCAQPYVGDIGLHGEARRIHGVLVPHYRLHVGGDGCAGGGIGIKVPEVPVARIEAAIARIRTAYHADGDVESFGAWARAKGAEYFHELLADFTDISESEVAALARDAGDSQDFRVFQFGGGECAGIAQETVSAAFAEAAHERRYLEVFVRQNMAEDAYECAGTILYRVGNALLSTRHIPQAGELESVAGALQTAFKPGADIVEDFQNLRQTLSDMASTGDGARLERFVVELDRWTDRAQAIVRRSNSQIFLSVTPGAVAERSVTELGI